MFETRLRARPYVRRAGKPRLGGAAGAVAIGFPSASDGDSSDDPWCGLGDGVHHIRIARCDFTDIAGLGVIESAPDLVLEKVFGNGNEVTHP
ncbi:hypothetical protein [Streptomyces sp. NPDC006012]|uniref:hypothetical protein n=1 Tax=Streptomyces sp. NPDC006012 TaxID=3364739 RepID=UPI0036CA24AB